MGWSPLWYTHLGYGRTMLSVRDSIAALETGSKLERPIRVTVLPHWPRCRKDISWMHCEQEERDLPERVKAAGPAPHLDAMAWQGSWRALEELYEEGVVSN